MHPFCLHRSSCLCTPPPSLLEVRLSVPNICSFPCGWYLIAWEKEFGGGERGHWPWELLGWTFPSIPPPHPPVLCSLINYCWQSGDHQWLAAARQTWFGGWSVGCGRVARGGKERKEVLQTALIKTLPREKRNATGPPWFKWPLNSFIYLWEWKTASFCILSLRLLHVSGQL